MDEQERLALGQRGGAAYREALAAAASDRAGRAAQKALISAAEQVWEDSPHGLLKHLVNESMGTAESCLDVYQQVIPAGGHSGRHRHFSEEVFFVLEGSGHDLHWDPIPAPDVVYGWRWQENPKRFEWQAGDFVRIPPYAIHQHFADDCGRARLFSVTSRIVKAMGLDGLEQLADASPAANALPA